MPTQIFISHRHLDQEIADVLSNHLQKWSIKRNEIFQSSSAHSGIPIGDKVSQAVTKALIEARLVFLIYTVSDADWSWCMWECGVAMDPGRGSITTRTILIRATASVPSVFREFVHFSAFELEDVKKFVIQFFREPGWLYDDRAFLPDTSDRILEEHADALYHDLIGVVPKKAPEGRKRWDMFTLRLDGNLIANRLGDDEALRSDQAIEVVRNEAKVVDDFGEALKHFGFVPGTRDLSLGELIQAWSEEVAGDHGEDAPRDWIDELFSAIILAMRNRPSKPIWAVMNSKHYPGWWFYPILNHVHVLGDGTMDFEIYMYRLPGSLPAHAVSSDSD